MKGAAAVAAGSLLAATASAQNGVVQWNIERRQHAAPLPRVNRRASTLQSSIANQELLGGYFANCSMGTPAQALTLQLDTGSSDIWAPWSGSSACQASNQNPGGCSLGAFNPNASSTFNDVDPNGFSITYVDGSHSVGDYFTDVFEIGGTSVKNVTMGLGLDTTIPYGLVGVGYTYDEANVSTEQSFSSAYPNLPVLLMEDGQINTVAYSLWLNDLDASTGNILFGGIDTDKYHGELTRVEIYKEPSVSVFTSFLVALTSLQAVSPSGSDNLSSAEFPIPVVLDSGTTLSYLPNDLAQEVWAEVGAEYDVDQALALIPCSMASSPGSFAFGFAGEGGPLVNVSMSELVIQLSSGPAPAFPSGPYKGQGACGFGIQNTTSGAGATYLLGDSFLRSAYVVYDLVNNEVGIAQTDFGATSSNVVPFASSGAPIPSSTPAPNQAQVANDHGPTTPPGYSARSGFGVSASASAGAMLTALEWQQLTVMGLSGLFVMAGSGLFMLF